MAENIGIYNGLNPLFIKDWYENIKKISKKDINIENKNLSYLKEKQLEIARDLNDSSTKISKLKQKKFIMNKKIVEINKVLSRLYSQKIQLQIQSFKYNMKLVSMMGNNIDITA